VRFKEGDRVRLNDKAPILVAGFEGCVVAVSRSLTQYLVDFAAGRQWIREELLEPAQTETLPEPASPDAAPLPPCAFCGEPGAPQEIQTGLRVQAETWHVCHRTRCNETIPYHRERLEAGLVDCAETRAATLRWVKERLGSK
jgi:hypothetical protein